MKIDNPTPRQAPRLLSLWKEIFGEYSGFWETFLDTAFSPRRCRCLFLEEEIGASLCWLDCEYEGQKLAYLYAVLTHPGHRGQGLCRTLLADTHDHLKKLGYAGAMLVPADKGLRRMYEKLGYQECTRVCEFSSRAGAEKMPLRTIGGAEYGALRRNFLPEGGVIQEGENLALLAGNAQFYLGEDVLLAAYTENNTLHAMELLGNLQKAPAIVAALDCRQGEFRCPGQEKEFAMFYPLKEGAGKPTYFGFAFD